MGCQAYVHPFNVSWIYNQHCQKQHLSYPSRHGQSWSWFRKSWFCWKWMLQSQLDCWGKQTKQALVNYHNSLSFKLHDNSTTDGDFDWDAKTRGMVLGAFFYGLTVSVLPGGMAAEKFGGKLIIQIGTIGSSLFALLCPLAARLGGSAWFIAARAIQGFFVVS